MRVGLRARSEALTPWELVNSVMISPQPPRLRMKRRNTVSVTPAMGASTVAGAMCTFPMSKLEGKLVIGPRVFYILAGRGAETETATFASQLFTEENPMKPLQVALLVVVSALAGGLFMKWEISRNVTPAAAAVPATLVTQAAAPAPVQPAAQQSQPAEVVEPAPIAPHKEPQEPKASARPHEVLKSRRATPVMMARNEDPLPAQPVAVAPPAVVTQPEPPAAADVQASQPVEETPQQPAQPVQEPDPVASIPSAPPATQVTLKAGLLIPVRTGEGLSSQHNAPGDGFTATLDQPLVVDGWVIAEKGARLEGKVVETGRGKAQPELVVALTQLRTSDGQRVAIETETYARHGQAGNGETAEKVIAGTVIGAAIGAIAGGGKGAAIGAGAGTAVGGGVAAATRSRPAVLPSETLVHFRLKTAVTITERQGRS